MISESVKRIARALLPLALVGCGALSNLASDDEDNAVHIIGAMPGDTGIVIHEASNGRLQATIGKEMVIFGPPPGIGSLGFTYRFGDLVGKAPTAQPTEYATITGVAPGSSADAAGLRAGDVLVAVNGADGRNRWLLRDLNPGTAYALRVRRDGQVHEGRVVVGPAPSRDQVEWDLRRQAMCIRQAAALVSMTSGSTGACSLTY